MHPGEDGFSKLWSLRETSLMVLKLQAMKKPPGVDLWGLVKIKNEKEE